MSKKLTAKQIQKLQNDIATAAMLAAKTVDNTDLGELEQDTLHIDGANVFVYVAFIHTGYYVFSTTEIDPKTQLLVSFFESKDRNEVIGFLTANSAMLLDCNGMSN